MEYLIGSAFTFIVMYIFAKNYTSTAEPPKRLRVLPYTQSSILHTTKKYDIALDYAWYPQDTQSFDHQNKHSLRIFIMGDNAYWIADSKVYMAALEQDGNISEDAKVLDIMGMSKVQLDEIKFVIEKLTEGTANDIRNSRDT